MRMKEQKQQTDASQNLVQSEMIFSQRIQKVKKQTHNEEVALDLRKYKLVTGQSQKSLILKF